MTTEPRIVAPQQKIGARPPAAAAAAPASGGAEPPAKGGKKRMLGVILGVVIAAAAGGGYWFLGGPGAAAAEPEAVEEEAHVELGEVQMIDPISLNLAGGHYLRLGLGLQLAAEGHGEVDSAKALDAAITLFSGVEEAELTDPESRDALKAELAERLAELYEGEVVGVYFTDLVTQ